MVRYLLPKKPSVFGPHIAVLLTVHRPNVLPEMASKSKSLSEKIGKTFIFNRLAFARVFARVQVVLYELCYSMLIFIY